MFILQDIPHLIIHLLSEGGKIIDIRMTLTEKSHCIKQIAAEHGFLLSGIAKLRPLEEERSHLEEWLQEGHHGEMQYMANHFEMRLDPSLLVPGSQSIISLSYNYFSHDLKNKHVPKVGMYASGSDYHKVLKKKLKTLWKTILEELKEPAKGRFFVDSAPVMERQWAQQAGLGWTGKNSLLIHPKHGSYFFLAEIISDLELEYDEPIKDYCGTCTKCIDACPTDAIASNGYVLIANKCISYLTIESKSDIPSEHKSQMNGWVFGCDICQQVCPWNRFSTPHTESEFYPKTDFSTWTFDQWESMTEQDFETTFGKTPLKRAGFEKIKKTLKSLKPG